MKSQRKIFLVGLIISVSLVFSQEKSESDNQIKMSQILKKTREYCQRLNQIALDFVCKEEIVERYQVIRLGPRGFTRIFTEQKHKLLYDYQLIRKGKRKEEKRMLLAENGIRKRKEATRPETKMFQYRNVIFGPNNLLAEDRQLFFDYKLVGSELLDGEKALIIDVIPRPWLTHDILSGRIWVSEKDYSILKIVWDEEIMASSGVIQQLAQQYKGEPRFIQITEFGFEKNGIRFPSKYFIEEAYVRENGKKKVHSEMSVIYKDYQFFTVETEVTLKK